MSEKKRRRIDQVSDPEFLADLDRITTDTLRERRGMCHDLEIEFSYYRRMLHGRMDLAAFEMRRRAGEEEQTLLEALPRILAEGAYTPAPGLPGRAVPLEMPNNIPRSGKRLVDKALDSNFLARLSSLTDDELHETQRFLQEVEVKISQQRQVVHSALDTLQDELARRYANGSADPSDALPHE